MHGSSNVESLRSRLHALLPMLAEQYQVESLALFGSRVRSEEHVDSDLDVLVTFSATPDLLQYIRLEQFLSETLGVQVDLVMKDALKPHIGAHILREATPV